MPQIRLSPEDIAVARVLAQADWTHGRIAAVFRVERSTVTHALTKRKTHLPAELEILSAQRRAEVMLRIDRAVCRAVVQELRSFAAELERRISEPESSVTLSDIRAAGALE